MSNNIYSVGEEEPLPRRQNLSLEQRMKLSKGYEECESCHNLFRPETLNYSNLGLCYRCFNRESARKHLIEQEHYTSYFPEATNIKEVLNTDTNNNGDMIYKVLWTNGRVSWEPASTLRSYRPDLFE